MENLLPAHIFRAPILSQLILYAFHEIGTSRPHKLRRVTRSEGGIQALRMHRLNGVQIVLLSHFRVKGQDNLDGALVGLLVQVSYGIMKISNVMSRPGILLNAE